MQERSQRALVIGVHGGVGRAVLALLQHSAPGRRLLERLDWVLLLDRCQPLQPVPLDSGIHLPPGSIDSAADLARYVRAHGITEVVDLSSIDTVDCTQTCEEIGADFLCTSVEEWPGQSGVPTDQAIAQLLPPLRPVLHQHSHLVGSGANPGIVNALVFCAIEEFARRAGQVVGLGHPPTARWYEARCGEGLIAGMAIPHEEIATLARRLPSVEIGFIYRIPGAARQALAAHPDRTDPAAWPIQRLYPPWTVSLSGYDRIGVLLCSRLFGELWMGFDTTMPAGLAFGTNATQLQVAAGVIAGWSQLGRRKGIHFVEDLDRTEFVRTAGEVLGEPFVVLDAKAPARLLAERTPAALRRVG